MNKKTEALMFDVERELAEFALMGEDVQTMTYQAAFNVLSRITPQRKGDREWRTRVMRKALDLSQRYMQWHKKQSHNQE
jgi:hypothetical protein